MDQWSVALSTEGKLGNDFADGLQISKLGIASETVI